jgi:hypothetical protein
VLGSVFENAQDTRAKNRHYSLTEIGLAAFNVFHMQSRSFLAWQREMKRRKGKSNAHSLYRCENIPSDEQIKNVLDGHPPELLDVVYRYVINTLAEAGHLDAFRDDGRLLLALDGTHYHASTKVACEQCNHADHGEERHYHHSVVIPTLVSPERPEVLCLAPAFVTPQDGHDKQDCETAAAKRWLDDKVGDYDLDHPVILGDDLYSRQPLCERVLAAGANFVFVCKAQSHPHLYSYLDLAAPESLQTRDTKTGQVTTYRFACDLPLRDSGDALDVNWCDVTVTDAHGKRVYYNAFITDLPLSASSVATVCRYGRARWKIENEANNVLKTKGYNIEHNFGHGQQHLAAILLSLMLLAFLFHTIFDLFDERYQAIRRSLGTRQTFFDDLRALSRYHYFGSWHQLLCFMAEALELDDQEAFDSS